MGLDSHADEGTGAPLVLVDHYALVVEDGVVHDKCSTGEEAMRKLIDHCKALVEQ